MSLLYFLLSRGRLLNLKHLSQDFVDETRTFTALSRAPLAVVVRPHGPKVRSILIEKLDVESILSKLGHTLERFLTEYPVDFNKMLLKNKTGRLRSDEEHTGVFHYTQSGSILLRSQIDCMDPRLPRKTFDLKTRATLPIRMDLFNHIKYLDYRLERQHGILGSFERELYDMARSAFLKYNLQARIGGMDGIFVAYHNTRHLFGFQYFPREHIDETVFGSDVAGDIAFKLLLSSYSALLDIAMSDAPTGHTARLTWVLSKDCGKMSLFVEFFSDYPTERHTIMPPAGTFTQYIVTSSCKINGVRVDAFPGVEDRVQLSRARLSSSLNVLRAPNPSREEFEAARAKCGEARLSAEDMSSISSGVMKQLQSRRPQSP